MDVEQLGSSMKPKHLASNNSSSPEKATQLLIGDTGDLSTTPGAHTDPRPTGDADYWAAGIAARREALAEDAAGLPCLAQRDLSHAY
ncbi:Hypothetical predicted protein [Pelobates cultripes]|uniref:Uncharacterized protein n=1 Tax=Pelobates cultripes TaxID=61616 RepID=A0AAD1S0Z9_PELCU|nr:Hypothetical predicted protein [Pelobates cultripes]